MFFNNDISRIINVNVAVDLYVFWQGTSYDSFMYLKENLLCNFPLLLKFALAISVAEPS